jgi:hypothetical protein
MLMDKSWQNKHNTVITEFLEHINNNKVYDKLWYRGTTSQSRGVI